MHKPLLLAAILAAAAPAGAALAHHGWSSYDAEQVLRIEARLTDVEWGNPHGSAKVRHAGKTWDVILAPVARMEARGLTQAMLAPDKSVVLEGYPRRDGTAEMRIERVTAGGKTVELR